MVSKESCAISGLDSLALNVMGGLCSRLRAVLAAADWCQRHGVPKLVISWPKDEPNLSEFGGFSLHLQALWKLPDEWYSFDSGIKQWPKKLDAKEQNDLAWYIRTCHPEPFAPSSVSALMKQLDRMEPLFKPQQFPDCIGVNVRWSLRESHNLTSTPEWFAERVNHVSRLTGCKDVKVVADSADGYKRFRAALASHLVVHENVRTFDYDGNGIAWQAQELYELASCRWFIGAEGSSYSQMVRWMRGDTEMSLDRCDPVSGRGEDANCLATDELILEVCG